MADYVMAVSECGFFQCNGVLFTVERLEGLPLHHAVIDFITSHAPEFQYFTGEGNLDTERERQQMNYDYQKHVRAIPSPYTVQREFARLFEE